MKIVFVVLLSLLFPSLATAQRAEMYLVGGAMKICSSLATNACRSVAPALHAARQPARYRVDDAGIERALAPALWSDHPGAPPIERLRVFLAQARMSGAASLDADTLSDRLDAICLSAEAANACGEDAAARPWRRLLDSERATILAAFELPAMGDARPREVVDLDASRNGDGVAILRAFVASAAERSGGQRPRIAFVTASAIDPYDAVDFYASALRAAGAEPVWWPVDSALETAVFSPAGCAALPLLRLSKLGLPQRERIFSDLTNAQAVACGNRAQLAAVPAQVQGVFFAGGDQWRLRQAFFDDEDRANPWLLALRAAFDTGGLVVGGTSAGTAVQSGGAMISNGSPERALVASAVAAAPPAAGCARARRCAAGLDEDDLSYWPAGGLALLPGWIFDTHFSQRDREPRLLRLLADTNAAQALGVDETSAVHLVRAADGTMTIEALGSTGAWLFERDPASGASGRLAATVSYLAPDRRLTRPTHGEWTVSGAAGEPCENAASGAPTETGGLLTAARRLATMPGLSSATVGAVRLSRTGQTRTWRSAAGGCGIARLRMDVVDTPRRHR
jgi:cyanophycinase-like exopeptidase